MGSLPHRKPQPDDVRPPVRVVDAPTATQRFS
jgi:hypothetical protein